MAIDIQPPNMSGLTAIAGKNAPLNLTPTGALGLQALQQRQAQENALRADALARMQLQQQGQLALGSHALQKRALDLQAQQQQRQGLLAQAQLGLGQQQFQYQGTQDAVENAYKQQQLAQQGTLSREAANVDRAKIMQEHLKQEMERLKDEKKEKIQEKGAFAAYLALSMKDAKSPEEAHQIRIEALKEAVEKGYYTKEQAQQAVKLPITQFNNLVTSELVKLGVAKEFKDAQPKETASGLHATFEDGQLASLSIDPNKATATEAQKDLKDRQLGLKKIARMRDEFNEKYFTYAGQGKVGFSKFAEKTQDIPIIGAVTDAIAETVTGKNKEGRSEDIRGMTKYINSVEQFFNDYKHQITGAAAGEKEIAQLKQSFLNGDMSPSEFRGALDQILIKYTSEAEFNKNILNEGLDTTSNDGLRQFFKQQGKSDEEIDDYLRKKGGK